MEKLNTTSDVKKYLSSGKMTTPFLRDTIVFQKVQSDQEVNSAHRTELESLIGYIDNHLKYAENQKIRDENKFRRTAKGIWKSKFTTGCADNALVFATMARQIGIPTTILETADEHFLEEFVSDSSVKAYRGHFFCECFYNEEWVLVDPTFNKVIRNYDVNNIKLPYKVGGSDRFKAYLREIDFGKERNVAKTNRLLIELSLKDRDRREM